jgi:bifunctional DNase/RNase
VVGVRVELPSNQPIVLLREVEGDRYLPIWIGAVEATAIAYEQQGVKPARPLTHDLLRDILAALKTPLQAVEIMEMKENIFYAELILGEGVRVSARPSDSIALALRVGARSAAPSRCSPRPASSSRRAGGRGREVPRVPRTGPSGGFRRLGLAQITRCCLLGVSRPMPRITLNPGVG